MADLVKVELGAAQETLFIPLANRITGHLATVTLFRASSR